MLTQELLLKSYYYNPVSGLFYRRLKSRQLKLVGSNKHGYLQATINAKGYLVHRLIWLYMTGSWPEEIIDHIDGNKVNNSWNNLRVGSKSNNAENQKKAKSSNLSTGLLGAYLNGKKFTAKIKTKGNPQQTIGTFDTAEEAHQAYLKVKRELHLFNTL